MDKGLNNFSVIVSKIALTLGLMALVASTPTQSMENQATFTAKLFNTISQEKVNQNVFISPASIQTCLALAYCGARGTTAAELKRGLHLDNKGVTKKQVAQQFKNLTDKMRCSKIASVKMANRIYVKQNLQIWPEFNEVAQFCFKSCAQNVDFSQNVQTAEEINNFIKQRTPNKIHDLISSNSLGDDTAIILVNAIYFKARWLNIFESRNTAKKDFHLSKINTKQVNMMFQEDIFGYAELSEFDAKALFMEYFNTNNRMLILLPNKLDGLGQLEQQLKDVDLTKLFSNINHKPVRVSLPKFRIEFDISLKPTLKALGMRELFSSNSADFSGLFTTHDQVAVSEVVHKTFIEFDEKGTEAAGVKVKNCIYSSAGRYRVNYDFNVDHPFYFAILDNETVFFAGHVVDI